MLAFTQARGLRKPLSGRAASPGSFTGQLHRAASPGSFKGQLQRGHHENPKRLAFSGLGRGNAWARLQLQSRRHRGRRAVSLRRRVPLGASLRGRRLRRTRRWPTGGCWVGRRLRVSPRSPAAPRWRPARAARGCVSPMTAGRRPAPSPTSARRRARPAATRPPAARSRAPADSAPPGSVWCWGLCSSRRQLLQRLLRERQLPGAPRGDLHYPWEHLRHRSRLLLHQLPGRGLHPRLQLQCGRRHLLRGRRLLRRRLQLARRRPRDLRGHRRIGRRQLRGRWRALQRTHHLLLEGVPRSRQRRHGLRAPASGCRLTGDICNQDADCCGAASSNVTCSLEASSPPVGRCTNPQGCQPVGNICGANGANARQDCCDGQKSVCQLDSEGISRCFGGADAGCASGYSYTDPSCCIAQGQACSFRDQCCDQSPCLLGDGGFFCTAPGCQLAGAACTPGVDGGCCPGLECGPAGEIGDACQPPRSGSADGGSLAPDAGTLPDAGPACAANGASCSSTVACCSGTCASGACAAQPNCSPPGSGCTASPDCCAGLAQQSPGSAIGVCATGSTSCTALGQACTGAAGCCAGLVCADIGGASCAGSACTCQQALQ